MMGRRWIGRWIFAVGVIHTLFGLIVFRLTWGTLFAEGLINTVSGQPEREFPFWFLATGIVTLLLGGLVDHLEARGGQLPSFLGWGLLAFTAATLVIMPISGGWLLVPPVLGAVAQRRRRVA